MSHFENSQALEMQDAFLEDASMDGDDLVEITGVPPPAHHNDPGQTTYEDQTQYNNRLAILAEIVRLACNLSPDDQSVHDLFKDHHQWNQATIERSKVLVAHLHQALVASKNAYNEGLSTDPVHALALPVTAEETFNPKKLFSNAAKTGSTLTATAPGKISITFSHANGYVAGRTIGEDCQVPFPLPAPVLVPSTKKRFFAKLPHIGNAPLYTALTTYFLEITRLKNDNLPKHYANVVSTIMANPVIDISYVNLSTTLKFYNQLFPRSTTAFGGIHPAFLDTFTSAIILRHDIVLADTSKARHQPLPLTKEVLDTLQAKLAARPKTGYTLVPVAEGDCPLSSQAEQRYEKLKLNFPLESPDKTFQVLLRACLTTAQYPGLFLRLDGPFSYPHLQIIAMQLSRVAKFVVLAPHPEIVFTVEKWNENIERTPANIHAYYGSEATRVMKELFNLLHDFKPTSFTMDMDKKRDVKSIDIIALWDPPATTANHTSAADELLFDLDNLDPPVYAQDPNEPTSTSTFPPYHPNAANPRKRK